MAENKGGASGGKAPQRGSAKPNPPQGRPERPGKFRSTRFDHILRHSSAFTLAAAILLFFVMVVDGKSVWHFAHNAFLGLFGIGVVGIVLFLFVASYLLSIEEVRKEAGSSLKYVLSSGMVLLSGWHVVANFDFYLEGTPWWEQVVEAWERGERGIGSLVHSGGAIGAVIGGALGRLGKKPALIILGVAMLTLIMLWTGHNLFSWVKRIREKGHKLKPVIEAQKGKLTGRSAVAAEPLDEWGKQEPEPSERPTRAQRDAEVLEALVREKPPARPKRERQFQPFFEPVALPEQGEAYKLPPITLLQESTRNADSAVAVEQERNTANTLIATLESFGVRASISDIARGPSVTRYELVPEAGVRINRITNLADDIALRLAAVGVRIEAPIPGKSAIGIEVPNKHKAAVGMREILDSPVYRRSRSKLNVALGRDISGNVICADLAKMPHLLIAGTTGSGKSVCMNTMIVSLLYNATPDEVRLLMIDPKQVEFSIYNGVPHLEIPVVSDARKAAGALAWAVGEMEKRYKLLAEHGARDISGYNQMAQRTGSFEPLTRMVIFIDELADLMMVAAKDVEDSICRLAQKARAAGIHLVIATQRPSVDVITGLIKANIPSRIALSVSSQVDSRTILDMSGAEKLLGYGDMLFLPVDMQKPVRVQGCLISDAEVEQVVRYVSRQTDGAEYNDGVLDEIDKLSSEIGKGKRGGEDFGSLGGDGEHDEMFEEAIRVVVEAEMASTTLLQRRLKLGYARASRVIDELEQAGVVGPFEGSKPRKVLISKAEYYERTALGGAFAELNDEQPPWED
ncbi:MAG: DNA translocase FtsK [Clostridium sp.]|jgi:S-DNA-T family DNA segregation ATPase FtsK/SpoIIIE|nr:DNA translocase FtsK [Clostridium sp.]